MNVFKTLNSTIEKSAYTIKIANIDACGNHWGSEKQIASALDDIENYRLDKENFDKNMLLFAIAVKNSNPRITKLQFYTIPEEDKLIFLATTDVRKFHDAPLFSREISISFKREKFSFALIEVLEEEKKQEGFAIPPNWKPEERMQKRFGIMANYAF